jgi:chaperonin GroEL
MSTKPNLYEIMQFGHDARAAMLRGADAIARAVKTTLGPKGRNVVIDRPLGPPHVTKDGVTVARDVRLIDPFEAMGARIIRGASERQAEEVGDGTTTVTVLAECIAREGMKLVAAGMNPMDIKRGIDAAALEAMNQLSAEVVEIDADDVAEIHRVALVSANGDEDIARAIAEAIVATGKEGSITVEEAPTHATEVELVKGFKIDSGYMNPYFITNQSRGVCELDDPLILIYEGTIGKMSEVANLLNLVIQQHRNLLIIADKIEDQIMRTLVLNRMKQDFGVCAIRAPGFASVRSEIMQDAALVTGTQVTSQTSNIRLMALKPDDLGGARRVVVNKDRTIIIDGSGNEEAVQAKCEELREAIKSKSGEEKKSLEQKLATLTGAIAILKIGAATQVEMTERKDRVDDAIHATRAALRGGILAGGGAPLVHVSEYLEDMMSNPDLANVDQAAGAKVLLKSLREPARQIALNSGVSADKVIDGIASSVGREAYGDPNEAEGRWNWGYDAQNGKFCDLVAAGIIDPAEVVISSVRNAASVAGLLITTECMITEKKEKKNVE